MKRFLAKMFVVAILCGAVAFLFNLTNGFSRPVSRFGVALNDEYIMSDVDGRTISQGSTMKVQHYGSDFNISVSVIPVKVDGDYTFWLNEQEYSWNRHIVGSGEDFANYMPIYINQDANTVAISGNLLTALREYGKVGGQTVSRTSAHPTSDMFKLVISSGGSSISIGMHIEYIPSAVAVSANNIIFGG